MTSYVTDVARAIRDALPPDATPDGDTALLFVFYALLCLTKGEQVTREDVHDAWSAWKTAIGEDHESLVPYDELTADIRREDEPFVEAIRQVAGPAN